MNTPFEKVDDGLSKDMIIFFFIHKKSFTMVAETEKKLTLDETSNLFFTRFGKKILYKFLNFYKIVLSSTRKEKRLPRGFILHNSSCSHAHLKVCNIAKSGIWQAKEPIKTSVLTLHYLFQMTKQHF